MIEAEMSVYRMLGVDERVLRYWREVHHEWNYKATYAKGRL